MHIYRKMKLFFSESKRSRRKRWQLALVALALSTAWRFAMPPHVSWPVQLEILDMYGQPIYATSSRAFHKSEDVPKFLRDSMLQLEDKRFRQHRWIDVRALWRAMYANVRARRIVQWASTIDQQLIKLQERAYHRTFSQKIAEVFWALKLNLRMSKEEILVSYLNSVPFPYGTVGVNWWCQIYFGKACSALSEHQLLFVIASWQLGSNPFRANDFKRTKERAIFLCNVLQWWQRCEEAKKQSPTTYTELIGKPISQMPHLVSYLISEYVSGTNTTRIDTQLYRRIQWTITTTFVQRESVDAQDCCVLVLDGAWEIISMNVCRERDDEVAGQVNGCLSKRQTWSTIKPFLYTYAMHALDLKSTDTIVDEPVSYFLDDESAYVPKNFDLRYHGNVTLAQALWNSLNIPAVKLLHDAGVHGFIEFLEKLRREVVQDREEAIKEDSEKFSADRQGLSLALWTYELSPLEFARLREMRFLPQTSFVHRYEQQIKDLSNVLQDPQNRIISFGQENYLNVPWWIVKTWTSRHFVDGRVCGAHLAKDRIVCVWMGNYNAKAMNASSVTTAGYLRRLVVDGM